MLYDSVLVVVPLAAGTRFVGGAMTKAFYMD